MTLTLTIQLQTSAKMYADESDAFLTGFFKKNYKFVEDQNKIIYFKDICKTLDRSEYWFLKPKSDKRFGTRAYMEKELRRCSCMREAYHRTLMIQGKRFYMVLRCIVVDEENDEKIEENALSIITSRIIPNCNLKRKRSVSDFSSGEQSACNGQPISKKRMLMSKHKESVEIPTAKESVSQSSYVKDANDMTNFYYKEVDQQQ